MARIGLDLDGVIFRFTKAFTLWCLQENLCPKDVDPEVEAQTWNWFLEWGMSIADFKRAMARAVDHGELFWTQELCEDTIPEDINRLKVEGHTIHIVTHRFSGAVGAVRDATEHCLAHHGIEYDSITYAKDKTSVLTDYFLEDNEENYRALLSAGVDAFLIDRPYNRDAVALTRVETFSQFVDEILSDGTW